MSERLLELLADEAMVGLDAEERAELDALLAASPETDPDGLARVAAQIDLAAPASVEELPDALRARIEADAASFLSAPADAPTARPPGRAAPGAQRRWLASAGWLAAAAGWSLWLLQTVPATTPVPETPSLAERVAQFEREAGDVVRVAWSPGGDATGEGTAGDVVWSDSRQEGYMRFQGLEANDPTREQYQLWIFDAARNEAHPVDGGVFDVSTDGSVIVPIQAHLPVERATLFAVTVEPPGGVVVSTRERIAVLAAVEG